MVETSSGWSSWAKNRTEAELEGINSRLIQLQKVFGKPHLHAGLGIRRLSPKMFEFRASRDLRVVFMVLKPDTFRLVMCGNHDEVRRWLKENV